MAPKDLSDEEAIALSREVPGAFSVIFDRYYEPFKRKARSILSSEDAAEDAVQDAFVRIYRYAGAFKKVAGASFRSWAYTILIRQCFSVYRKQKRDATATIPLDEELQALLSDSDEIEQKLDVDMFQSVADRMPETLRRVLAYMALGGKTIADIARLEGVSVGAVRTRLSRARKEFERVCAKMV